MNPYDEELPDPVMKAIAQSLKTIDLRDKLAHAYAHGTLQDLMDARQELNRHLDNITWEGEPEGKKAQK